MKRRRATSSPFQQDFDRHRPKLLNVLLFPLSARLKPQPAVTLRRLTPRGPDANGTLMGHLTSLCVYCGSAPGTDPAIAEAAVILGRAMAESGIRLVYGGGSVGLMGTIARAVLDAGGRVTGIIPAFLQSRERPTLDLSELIVTDTMHERKMLMFERAEGFVALPGGIGTLEELVEQLTWAQLGRHRKPVLLANISGFWDPLLSLVEQMRRAGFIRDGFEVTPLITDDAAAIVPMLIHAAAGRRQAELDRTADAGPISRM